MILFIILEKGLSPAIFTTRPDEGVDSTRVVKVFFREIINFNQENIVSILWMTNLHARMDVWRGIVSFEP